MSEKTIYRKDIDRLFDEGLDLKRLNGKTILVVGATGLIGSCVVDVLMLNPDRGYRVVAAGRNRLRARTKFAAYWDEADFGFVEMDVTQPMDEQCEAHGLSAQGIDFVIDAASNASPNFFREKPVEVMKANFDGVAHLIEFGLQHGMKRMVYCASVRACYPSSKRAAETLCMAYGAEYGADVVIARLSHTYGPGFTESDNRVYAQFIRNVLRGEDIVLKSRGEAFRSWLYVVDAALEGERANVYNVAHSESNISIRELAELIARKADRKVVFDIAEDDVMKGNTTPVTKATFNTDKLKALGWKPLWDVESGFGHTIEVSFAQKL